MNPCIGIDLGGTNVRVALYQDLRVANTRPIVRHQEPVGDVRDPGQISQRLAKLVETVGANAGLSQERIPVGVGFAGMLKGDQGFVSNSPHFGWRDVDFGAALAAALGGKRPAAVFNDVNAITYGEYSLGAGIGCKSVLAVFVGTGIGAGIVDSGELLTGATGCAAEIGHVKVAAGSAAAPCNCGRQGCIEAYAGGSYLQARIRRDLLAGAKSRIVDLAGGAGNATPGHLDQAAAEGDSYAVAVVDQIAPLLGQVLANALTLLNPSMLILGGGVLSRTPYLRGRVMGIIDRDINPPAGAALKIVDAALGDDAGLVGSALLGARAAGS